MGGFSGPGPGDALSLKEDGRGDYQTLSPSRLPFPATVYNSAVTVLIIPLLPLWSQEGLEYTDCGRLPKEGIPSIRTPPSIQGWLPAADVTYAPVNNPHPHSERSSLAS